MHEHHHGMEEQQEDLLDLHEVMQAFGVEEWHNLGPLGSALHEGLKLRVEIKGEQYILRERPEEPVEVDSGHRYRFQDFLRQSGIPIPVLWLTPNGEPSVTIGEDTFELQQSVEGELFTTQDPRSLRYVAAAAKMLGRIHQLSRRYPGPEHRWPSETQSGGLVQGWLNIARSKAETSEIHAISSALSNWVEQWEAVLPAAMMSIGSVHGLPEFHIHGDYHAFNLRFGIDEVSAVMGFEASRWEKRIIELAYALFYYSALDWNIEQPLTRPLVKRGFEPERAHTFLQSYGAIYPPVPGEASILVDALTLVSPILSINGPLEDLFFVQDALDETTIDDILERLSWASSLPAWLQRIRRSFAEMWG